MAFGPWSNKHSRSSKKTAKKRRAAEQRKSVLRAPKLDALEDRRMMALLAIGDEFRINSDASVGFDQRMAEIRINPFPSAPNATEGSNRAVAVDHDGDFAVVWTSYGDEDGDGGGVFARVYDRFANLRTEIQVNAFAGHPEFLEGNQRNASIAMDADGDFVVTWQSDNQGPYDGSADIFARRFDTLGNPLSPPFRVNSVTVGDQIHAAVGMDYFGNFVVSWESRSEDGSFFNNVKAQRYSYEGVPLGSEFRVNEGNLPGLFSAQNPAVAVQPNGAFIIAYESGIREFGSNFFGSEVLARLYDANGAPLTASFDVDRPAGNPYSNLLDDDPRGTGMIDVGDEALPQRNPQVAVDREGNFTIVWESYQDNDFVTDDDDPDSWGIYMRRYHYDGRESLFTEDALVNPVFTVEPVDGQPILLSPWAGDQYNPSVALEADGKVFFVYSGPGDIGPYGFLNGEPFDLQNSDIWLRRFIPSAFLDVTDNDTGLTTINPGPIGTAGGSPDPGSLIFPSLLVNQRSTPGIQRHPTIAVEPDGDAIVVWDGVGPGDPNGIYAKRYNEPTDAVGPLVTNVVANGRRITDNMQVVDNVTQLTVTFDEQVFDDNNVATNGVNEVTNKANWKLLKNGVEILNAIRNVTFQLNPGTGKWEAVLTLDGNGPQSGIPALSSGNYELVALKNIRDLLTNPLSSFGNLENGVGFNLDFSVVATVGGEGLVNTTVSGVQQTLPESPQHVAVDATGASVVVWAGNGSGDSSGVFFQRYDRTGNKIGIETLVNVGAYAAGEQTNPAVAIDADGDFVVTWSSYGNSQDDDWDVYAQKFTSQGAPQGATFRVNTSTVGIQRYSSVAVDADGDFQIAWQSYDQDGSGYGVYARRFNAAGEAVDDVSETQVIEINGDPTGGTVTFQLIGDENVGDRTFGPIDFTTDNFGAVFAQRIEDALRGPNALNPILDVDVTSQGIRRFTVQFKGRDSNKDFSQLIPSANFTGGDEPEITVRTVSEGVVGEFRVNATTVGNQMFPQVATDAFGNFVVVWTSFGQDGDSPFESNIYGQRFNNDGSAPGINETQALSIAADLIDPFTLAFRGRASGQITLEPVPTNGQGLDLAPGMRNAAVIQSVLTGGTNPLAQVTVTYLGLLADRAVYAVEFIGSDQGRDQPPIGLANGDPALISIATLVDGSPNNEFRINQTVSGNQQYPSIAMDLDGDFVVTWTAYGLDGVGNGYGAGENGQNGVFARRFTSSGDPVPSQNFTQQFTSTDVPLSIADAVGFGVSKITVPGDFIVTDVNVTVNITHTRDSDVLVSLAGPNQDPLTQPPNLGVTMFGGLGGLGRNFSGTVLDDEAGQSIAAGTAPFTGRFRPANALSAFDGIRGQGEWKLVVADTALGQIGTLTGWTLQVSGTVPAGDEFLVNTFAKGNQQYSRVSMDADGDFTIVWESFQDDPQQLGNATSYGVYAQRYARNDLLSSGMFGRGGATGGEFRVPTTLAGDQRFPGVALDPNGNATFVWSGNGIGDSQGVYSRRLASDNSSDLAGPIVTDVRYEANEIQVLKISDNPTGGSFRLQVGTQLFGPITYSPDGNGAVTAANIQAALRGPGVTPIFDVTVTARSSVEYAITFKNKDGAVDQPTIVVLDANFIGTGTVTTSITTETEGADQQVFEDATIEGNVTQLVVRFNEEMYQGGGPTGPNSILNPANWVLVRDGQVLNNVVTRVTFGLSQGAAEMLGNSSGKWEAVLFLDGSTTLAGVQPLADGEYTLTLLPNVQDLARNALDGNYNGSPGGAFLRDFTIVQPVQAGDEFLVNINDVTGTQGTGIEFADGTIVSGSQSVATDDDGHTVVVYTSRNSSTNPDGIYYELFLTQPDGTRKRLRRGRVDTGAQGRVETPAVAMDADGDFVVTWTGYIGSDADVYMRGFTAGGVNLFGETGQLAANADALTGVQKWSSVAMDVDGDFIVTWTTIGQNDDAGTGNGNVMFQRFSAEGGQLGGATQANNRTNRYTSNTQTAIPEQGTIRVPLNVTDALTVLDVNVLLNINHSFVGQLQVFLESPTGTRVELINGAGANPQLMAANLRNTLFSDEASDLITDARAPYTGTFRTQNFNAATDPQLLSLFDGEAAQGTWVLEIVDSLNIITGSNGTDLTFDGGTLLNWSLDITNNDLVSTTGTQVSTGNQRHSRVAADAQNGFVIVWEDDSIDDDGFGIVGQAYAYTQTGGATGGIEVVGANFVVNQTVADNQVQPIVATDRRNGDFVIAWASQGQDGEDYGVYARRYTIANNATDVSPLSGEFQVNTSTSGDQQFPSLAIDADGDFTVVWQGKSDGDIDQEPPEIFMQRFTSGGATRGREILVNKTVLDSQTFPSVAATGKGDLIVVWSGNGTDTETLQNDNSGVFGRQFPEVNDVNGPIVADVIIPDATAGGRGGARLTEGEVISVTENVGLTQLLVTFGENMRKNGTMASQITNPQNWSLTAGGSGGGGVSFVDYKFNETTQRYEALLTLDRGDPATAGPDGFLAAGDYMLTLRSVVEDVSGNNLDGQFLGTTGDTGNNFVRRFRIGGSVSARTIETLVNTTTSNVQRTEVESPGAVAVDADGDYVVVWTSVGQDGDRDGVYMQRYTAAGARKGGETRVNTTTEGNQNHATVALDKDGDIIVTWTGYGQEGDGQTVGNIYARRFHSDGVAIDSQEFRVNTTTLGNQKWSTVAADVRGDFVITWTSYGQEGNNYGIYAQRYNTAGVAVGNEFRVNETTAGHQQFSSAAMDADGNFIVTWTSFGQNGDGVGDGDVFARRFDAAGNPLGGQFLVNTLNDGAGDQRYSRVGADLLGNFVIVWTSTVQDLTGPNIFARRFAADGTPAVDPDSGDPLPEFRVNLTSEREQQFASVAVDHDGDFVVSWSGFGNVSTPSDPSGVFARRFSSDGTPLGPPAPLEGPNEFTVNTTTNGAQQTPSVGAAGAGSFVVVWNGNKEGTADGNPADNQGVVSRRFGVENDDDGPIVTDVLINNVQVLPDIALTELVTNIQVVFGEDLSKLDNVMLDSVRNPNNWVLTRNGTVVVGGIVDAITFARDPNSGKWIANIPVDGNGLGADEQAGIPPALPDGEYVLTARDFIKDIAGNRLDGDYDGATGGDFNIRFLLGQDLKAGAEFRNNSTTDGVQATQDESRQSIAADDDGDFVVVWSGNGIGDSDGVFLQLYRADGSLVLPTALLVNQTTGGKQTFASVAMDGDGDFLVTWTSYGQDGDASFESNVYARAFNPLGQPLTNEFRVNDSTAGSQRWSSAAMSVEGDVVVTWTDIPRNAVPGETGNVLGRRFDATGVARGSEFRVGRTTQQFTTADDPVLINPALNAPEIGTSTIDIASAATIRDLNVQVDISGSPDFFNVTLIAPDGTRIRLSRDLPSDTFGRTDMIGTIFDSQAGRSIVDGDPPYIGAFRPVDSLDSLIGRPLAGTWTLEVENPPRPFSANFPSTINTWSIIAEPQLSLTAGREQHSAVAMDAEGNFIVAFESGNFEVDPDPTDGVFRSGFGILAQRFDSSGAALGQAFQVNTFVAGDQTEPTVAVDRRNGDFVIAWTSDKQDGSKTGVYAQRFNANGVAQGLEFQVNTTVKDDQQHPSATMDADGDFVIVWSGRGDNPNQTDLDGVFAQRFSPDGGKRGGEFRVNSSTAGVQENPSIAGDGTGNFIIAWSGNGDRPTQQDTQGVFAQRYRQPMDTAGPIVTDVQTVSAEWQRLRFANSANLLNDADVSNFRVAIQGAAGDRFVTFAGLNDAASRAFAIETALVSLIQANPALGLTDADVQAITPNHFSVRFTNGSLGTPSPNLIVTNIVVPVNGPAAVAQVGKVRDARQVTDGGLIESETGIAQLVVVFGENLSTVGGTAGVNSVTNPNNWSVRPRTASGGGGVTSVDFRLNPFTRKYEATLTLDSSVQAGIQAFGPGEYVLTANQEIQDIFRNALDGQRDGDADSDGDEIPGADFTRTFRIRVPATLVNTTTTDVQRTELESPQAVAVDADGDYVVVWTSALQDGSGDGVFMQVFNSAGQKLLKDANGNIADRLVNEGRTTGNQNHPAVALDKDGDILVTWTSYGSDGDNTSQGNVYARRFTADGAPALDARTGLPQGIFRVNTTGRGNQHWSSAAVDVDGDFVISWTGDGQDGSGDGVFARRYDTQGNALGQEFQINVNTAGDQRLSTVAMDASGAFVVTWTSIGRAGNEATDGDILARLYDASGNPLTGEIEVQTATVGDQRYSRVARDVSGDFVVSWTSNVRDGNGNNIFARRFNADGTATINPATGTAFPEFQVNVTTGGDQSASSVAMSHSGQFVVTWSGQGQQVGQEDVSGVFARFYDSNGSPLEPPLSAGGDNEFLVNTSTAGDQRYPSVGMDETGGFTIAWSGAGKQDDSGVYVRQFPADRDQEGPIVTDVVAIDTNPALRPVQVLPGSGINGQFDTLQVIFGEQLSTLGGTAGADSVLNPANWELRRNGTTIAGAVQAISFAQHPLTRKWIATLSLDGNGVSPGDPVLPDGDYELIARDTLRDTDGNRLDGNFDGAADIDFSRLFNISRPIQDGGQFLVNSPTATNGTQATGDADRGGAQAVASDDAGNYVVVYTGPGAGALDGTDVYYSVFNRDGSVRVREQRANVIVTGNQSDPAVAMDADGDFVISWTDYSDTSRNGDIYYRVFNANGTPFSLQTDTGTGGGGSLKGGAGSGSGNSELLASSATKTILQLPQKWSTVAMDTDGDFVVGWTGFGQNGDEVTEGNIFARTFSKEGVPLSEETQVNSQAGTIALPDADLRIPATGDQGTVTSTITVDEGQLNGLTILDVNVTVNISHVFDSDLTLSLISPTGTIVTLANRVGGAGNDFLNTTFDDEASRNIDDEDSIPPFIGTYRAQFADRETNPERLSDFDGEVAVGDWQLVIVDNIDNRILDIFGNDTFADFGTLNSWSLTITTVGDAFGTADQLPTGNQQKPRAAMDAQGNVVVVWEEANNPNSTDSNGFGIRGQLLSSTGSPIGSDFPINTQTTGNQADPTVAADRRNGNFVVAWASDTGDNDGSGIFARRFDLGGVPADAAEFLVNSTTVGQQIRPAAAMDANDNVVITWSGNPQQLQATGFDVYGQRYTAQGVRRGAEFVVNTFTAGSQSDSGVASDGAGDFVVVWSGSGAEDADGVYGQRYKVSDDGAGPVVADVLFGPERVTDNAILVIGNDGLSTLTVTFGEEMFVGGDPSSEFNVENPANWSLTRNGVGAGGVSRVRFARNATTLKWEAVLTLDAAESQAGQQAFRDGDYVLTLRGTASDVSRDDSQRDSGGNIVHIPGNGLDGQAIGGGGNPGTDFVRRFRVDDPGIPTAVPSPVGGVLDEVEIVVPDTLDVALRDRINPDVAVDRLGNSVVVFQQQDVVGFSGFNIFFQRFNAAGRPLGEQTLVNLPTGLITGRPLVDQINAKVAMDRDGNFVVVWQGGIQVPLNDPNLDNEDPNGIYARRYNRFGVPLGDQFRVNELPILQAELTPQVTPDVAMNDIGDFVVTWSSQEPLAIGAQADADGGVYARCYGRNGQPASAQFRVNSTTNNRQENSAIAMDAAGNFVITWDSYLQDGSLWGVFGQRFSVAGARLGGEFQVNTFTPGFQRDSVVAMDADGDFVVAYTSVDQDGSGYGIYARRYNSAGVPQGNAFLVNNSTQFNQLSPDIGMNDAGDFIVTWQSLGIDGDLNGIAARAFKADGTSAINPDTGQPVLQFPVNQTTLGDQRTPSIGVDSVGNFTIAWSRQGLGADLFSNQIVIQPFRFNPNVVNLAGTEVADNVVVTLTAAGGQITVNGVTANLSAAGGVFNFDAKGGQDNVTVNAPGLNLQADLWPTTGRIEYGNLVITLAAAESITVNAGAGSTVTLNDAATTNDQLVTGALASTLSGVDLATNAAYSLVARGFTNVFANASGGTDNAVMSDTAGDDVVTGGPGSAVLTGSGLKFTVAGFPMINVVSSAGRDTATLNDSTGDDLFEGAWDTSRLTAGNGTVNPLVTVLSKFSTVRIVGSTGFDRARLTDSPGDDSLILRPDSLSLAGPLAYSFFAQVRGFDDARANASAGNDSANVYDSTGDDTLILRPGSAQLAGIGFLVGANGFDQVRAQASSGSDTVQFYDSTGNDQFVAAATYAQLTSPGYFNYAKGFDNVKAFGSTGFDTASLYDSTGDDVLNARPDATQLSGLNYVNYAKGFDEVRSYASTGNDRATMYDSAGNDQFLSTSTAAHLFGAGYLTYAQGFKSLRTFASTGADVASIYGSGGVDSVIAAPDYTRLASPTYNVFAQNFPSVSVMGNAASTAILYDSAGDDELLSRPEFVQLHDKVPVGVVPNYNNVVRNFGNVQVVASTGNDTGSLEGAAAGNNTATLGPMVPGSALLSSNESMVQLAGPGFATTASGFNQITVNVNPAGSNNRATLVDTALDDDLLLNGSVATVQARLLDVLWSAHFQNFNTVRAETLNGGVNTQQDPAVIDFVLEDFWN